MDQFARESVPEGTYVVDVDSCEKVIPLLPHEIFFLSTVVFESQLAIEALKLRKGS